MGENQTTNRAVSDVVFDFCGVLIDWQCHAALDGVYPEQLVADICADNDPYGFFHYEDLMDGGADFADVLELVRAEQGDEIAEVYRYYIEHYGDALPQLVDGAEELLTELCEQGVHVWGLTNWSADTFHFAFEKYPQLQRLLSGTVVSGIETVPLQSGTADHRVLRRHAAQRGRREIRGLACIQIQRRSTGET